MPLPPDLPDPKRRGAGAQPSDPRHFDFSPPPLPPPLPPPPPDDTLPGPDGPMPGDAREARRVLAELARRRIEALNLYEPLKAQEEFHASAARNRLLRGSNRGGKTLPAAVELARAVTGRDPHGKYPERDGRAYIVGKDFKHIGEVLYRKLFRAGAFRMIRDEQTGAWRAYRPWLADDRARKRETKAAGPLIPPRYVKDIAWEKKAENVVSKVVLSTGWELNFFSSLGKPPQGMDLDLVWFDEEIVDGEWYPEMSARLIDRGGRFYWSATPQAGTDRLYELHLRCEKELDEHLRQDGPEPTAREYVILLADNPHIDEEQKRALAADLDDAAHQVRIGGEFAILTSKVYPEFNKHVHLVDYFDVPPDWTRYVGIDPGRQVCACLFLAVPPEVVPGNHVYLYDELYIPDCDAAKFAAKMATKCAGQDFEAFVIDAQMGRQTEIGSGVSIEAQYRQHLAAQNVTSRLTGSGFAWGASDVKAGVEKVRSFLRVRPEGTPRLKVLKDRCANFLWEVERYRYKRVNNLVTDEPESRGRVHAMAALRYLCMYDPKWVARQVSQRVSGAYAAFLAKLKRQPGPKGVRLGPKRTG